jgi:hypothetical protein
MPPVTVRRETYGARALIHGKQAADGVATDYVLDSGCVGDNVMGKNVLDMLRDVVVEHLDPPVMLQNPWNGAAACSCRATATVVLETRLGPCVFTGVRFLVCELPIKSLYFGTTFQLLLGLPVLEDAMGQRYAGTTTSLESGTAVRVLGLDQQVAAWKESQAQGGPRITMADGGADPTSMSASAFGWSMADVGDDGVDPVPGEQAAFDDILPEPGQDDAEAVRAERA